MDNLSDSFKAELDSATSTDSLQLISDEFHIRHLSTPDVSNIELSKRIALLELENERFRIDLENMRIELNARIVANEGLKGKITELFIRNICKMVSVSNTWITSKQEDFTIRN